MKLMKQRSLMLVLVLAVVLLTACAPITAPAAEVGMPNPASENCVAQGGTLEIRQGEGGEAGYCVFADGSECEEWALMRGECAPGQSNTSPTTFDRSLRLLRRRRHDRRGGRPLHR
jgi:putative hemolysin